jgi:predicted alpha/beta superfamily hydrolase
LLKFILFPGFLFLLAGANAQYSTSVAKIYSANVKDSFEIYITQRTDSASVPYDEIIYYLDADLKSGKKLRQLAEDDRIKFRKRILFVGIGHIGNYHQLRRRDFILPFIQNGDTIPKSPEYGQIDRFYKFLNSELIPSINTRYASTGRRSIVGHSLGGLFVVYCLFRNEGIFDAYFALSPSLWIDGYQIFSFNRLDKQLVDSSYFFFAAGKKERFNHILKGFDKMEALMKEKNYPGILFRWHIYPGTHNSYIKKHLDRILYQEILSR